MSIENCQIIEKIFKRNRWFVKLEPSFNGYKTMPLAHYKWLKGNPSFQYIPNGYVIHHLDNDEQNDDITNLVLMQKHHHSSYHWKHKQIKPKIKIRAKNTKRGQHWADDFSPINEPAIRYNKKTNTYWLYFREEIEGMSKRKYVGMLNGKKLKTYKDAEWAKNLIWNAENLSVT